MSENRAARKMRSRRTLLWWQTAAFAILVATSWADEIFGLSSLPFAGPRDANLREALFETLVVVLVAVPVVIHTWRVVRRPFDFEGFLKVCAWCKKVHEGSEWLPVHEFFLERFDARTSHGICPAFFATQDGGDPGRLVGGSGA